VGTVDTAGADPLALSQEMEELLDGKIGPGSTEMNRLKDLVWLIFNDDDVGFVYESVTRTAIGTFQHRNGNCLSFTNLFVAMARYLDLDARFREVETAPSWSRKGAFVTFNRHVNVAINVGGAEYVVDLFPRIDRIEIGGRVVSDNRGLAHFYNNMGTDALAAGNPDLALSSFGKALEYDPEAAFVWANLGVAYSMRGETARAEQFYRKAIELDKNEMVAMSNLAELYRRMGQDKKADRYFKRVENFQKKNPYYHFSMGEEDRLGGRLEQALEHYKDALKRKSKEHHFHFAISRLYAQMGDLDTAVKHLEKAQEYAPAGPRKSLYIEQLERLNSESSGAGTGVAVPP